ncbi:FAD-binding protein, partial [candidate division WOR-3 bacterium]|nr:FAD-binding protein [candidate division WOR-3 bacterium]
MYDWRRALSEALGLGSAGEKPGVAVMRRDEPMAKHTTFAIGGPADVWVQVKTRRALLLVLDFCRTQRVGWRVLGKGSNVLVSDQGLRGVALALGGELAEVSRVPGLGAARGEVVCGAGATLDGVASFAEREGLVGVEFLAGIPGTVGGGLMSNAGAFGRSLGEVVSRVAVIDRNGNERELADSELQRGYRQ